MNKQPLITGDGSSSFYSEKYGEPYHSRHGAVAESMHVFIAMGLEALSPEKKEVEILEMGLGTGLNVLLTCLYPNGRIIRYTALEAEPVEEAEWRQLNYSRILDFPEADRLFTRIHEARWSEDVVLRPGCVLRKEKVKLQEYHPEGRFDLVYFDAFAPEAQPELWTSEIFARIHSWLNPGAILVTYSAKGSVRRTMLAAGFEVEKVPGPPGKREMLRARVAPKN